MIDAPVLVALANAGRPRRPSGAPAAVRKDPFEDAGAATTAVAAMLGRPVLEPELDGLRALAPEAGRIAGSIVQGKPPPVRALNRFAIDCPGHVELRLTAAGTMQAATVWQSGPAAAVLARLAIEELGGIEPSRLRRCARPECALIFYDSSRTGRQRWHSEAPCGWRERQRRRRRTSAPPRG